MTLGRTSESLPGSTLWRLLPFCGSRCLSIDVDRRSHSQNECSRDTAALTSAIQRSVILVRTRRNTHLRREIEPGASPGSVDFVPLTRTVGARHALREDGRNEWCGLGILICARADNALDETPPVIGM